MYTVTLTVFTEYHVTIKHPDTYKEAYSSTPINILERIWSFSREEISAKAKFCSMVISTYSIWFTDFKALKLIVYIGIP